MIIFKKTKDPSNQFDRTDITVESDSVSIPDLLNDFEDFLRGCGYQFNGTVEIVEFEQDLEIELDECSDLE